MNAIISNYKDTVYRLRMNKKTRTIKIDVYNLSRKNNEWMNYQSEYLYTLNCLGIDKGSFNYYYDNYATFNDVRQLAKTADNHTTDFTLYYKFKF